jgi:hypothetical protein
MYLKAGIGEESWYRPELDRSPSTLPPVGILRPPSTRILWLAIASIAMLKPGLRLREGTREEFIPGDGGGFNRFGHLSRERRY